jgi:hypothetical protein
MKNAVQTQEGSRVLRILSFLGAFAKYRNATVSLVVSLSIRMEQLGSHGRIFMKFDI